MKRHSRVKVGHAKLPEERQFQRVLKTVVIAVAVFMLAFLVLTGVKAVRSPQDITSNWFVAWGTWAGGLSTAAAFLIAAFSILVASAHSRFDRRQEAEIRENNDMAQARLLIIYKVEDEGSLSSLPTYRIENRSKDWFFDVTVPFVDSPNGAYGIERRTAALVAKDNRLHEFVPSGEQLTPYRDLTDDEAWFTLVTVHTTDASGIKFTVEYTDAHGRRWCQDLGGEIKRVHTTRAIPVRPPDRFQPPQQIRRLSKVEAWQTGFTDGLSPLETDEEFLEVLGADNAVQWTPIQRFGEVEVEPRDDPHDGLEVSVTYIPKSPPFWHSYFREKLAESGLRYTGGRTRYERTDRFLCPSDVDVADLDHVFDAAIRYANDRFEEKELAAARRALES